MCSFFQSNWKIENFKKSLNQKRTNEEVKEEGKGKEIRVKIPNKTFYKKDGYFKFNDGYLSCNTIGW